MSERSERVITARSGSWQLLRRLLRSNRRALGWSIAGGLLWQFGGIVTPLLIGWIVDRGIGADDRRAIWWGAALLLAVGAVEAAGAALRHRNACVAFMGANAELRVVLTEAALELDDEGQTAFPPGEVVARETSDAATVAGLLDAVGQTVATAVSIPVVVGALVWIDSVLGAVVALVVPISMALTWRYSVVWERRSTIAQTAMGETVQAAQETVELGKVLRGIGAEAAAVDRFAGRSERLRRDSVRLADLWIVFEPLLEALSLLSVALVLWLGGLRVVSGDLPLGDVVTAIGLVLFLGGPVRTVGGRILTVQSALASAGRIVAVLDAVPPPDPRTAAPPTVPGSTVLAADGVVVARRGGDRPLLRADVSFEAGTTTLVRGATGSGKSTLLATLAGRRRPLAGDLALHGAAIDRWPRSLVRERVLLTGATPFLFAGTVADNLRVADPAAGDDAIVGALAAAQCEFVGELPDGVDAAIGERGVTLSGGQRQRLALARAVLARPDVLLVDGGTSALDPHTEVALVQALRAALPDAAIALVSDNPALERFADRLVTVREQVLEHR